MAVFLETKLFPLAKNSTSRPNTSTEQKVKDPCDYSMITSDLIVEMIMEREKEEEIGEKGKNKDKRERKRELTKEVEIRAGKKEEERE